MWTPNHWNEMNDIGEMSWIRIFVKISQERRRAERRHGHNRWVFRNERSMSMVRTENEKEVYCHGSIIRMKVAK
jgi:hypothetical protein